MQQQVCMLCRFNDSELRDLENVKRFLERHSLTDVRSHEYFNFGSSPRCQFGMTCYKTQSARSKFNTLETEVSRLLCAYIEQTDCADIHDLLRLLQGRFPQVYRQVEIMYRKKGSE